MQAFYIGPKKGYRAVFAADGNVIAIVVVVAARSDRECYKLAITRLRLLADAEQKNEMTQMLMSLMEAR